MSKFQQVIEFFNNLPEGEFINRKMFLSEFNPDCRKYSQGFQPYETYRCYLMRAGYLYDPTKRVRNNAPLYNYKKRNFPFGIYFKIKKIPKNITLLKLIEEAYGTKNKDLGNR